MKSKSKILAAKVPVQAPVPGKGIPTNKNKAKYKPFPAVFCNFLPPFSPLIKHQLKNLPMNLLLISYLFMMVFVSERLYMKTNHPWWATLIPIYNNLVFSKIILGNFWLGLIGFIPIVNVIFYFIIFVNFLYC